MAACLLCGAEHTAPYVTHVQAADVCFTCADAVANAYSMAHSGRWLSWPNEFVAAAYKKQKISRELSRQVFERDAYRCVVCAGYHDLTCDHVVPESKGGATAFENLQTMCRSCNSRKGANA